MVVEKEAGWLTVPSRQGVADERPVLGKKLEEELGRQVFPVHRLDFEVSGLVLFALTAEAHRVANGWFENHQVKKLYQALTENRSAEVLSQGQEFEWKCLLARGKKRAYEQAQGKPSVTRARFLGERTQGLAWELEPITGRSHQLRFELARHGYPILGDKLYGAETLWSQGIALRSVELRFETPEALNWGLPEKITVSRLF